MARPTQGLTDSFGGFVPSLTSFLPNDPFSFGSGFDSGLGSTFFPPSAFVVPPAVTPSVALASFGSLGRLSTPDQSRSVVRRVGYFAGDPPEMTLFDVLDIPRQQTMQFLEEKTGTTRNDLVNNLLSYRSDPSSATGVERLVAGLGVDIATDPLTYAGGIGLLSKLGLFGKLGKVDDVARAANSLDNLTDAGSIQRVAPSNAAFRIRARNVADPVDTMTARQIGSGIASDPVAARAYLQLRDRVGADVVLDFGRPPVPTATGRVRNMSEIEIFARNLDSVQEGVATFVHESRHISDIQRGISNPFRTTQLDEFRAFRREFLSTHGRRPTLAERATIRQSVQQLYTNLPAGR